MAQTYRKFATRMLCEAGCGVEIKSINDLTDASMLDPFSGNAAFGGVVVQVTGCPQPGRR